MDGVRMVKVWTQEMDEKDDMRNLSHLKIFICQETQSLCSIEKYLIFNLIKSSEFHFITSHNQTIRKYRFLKSSFMTWSLSSNLYDYPSPPCTIFIHLPVRLAYSCTISSFFYWWSIEGERVREWAGQREIRNWNTGYLRSISSICLWEWQNQTVK